MDALWRMAIIVSLESTSTPTKIRKALRFIRKFENLYRGYEDFVRYYTDPSNPYRLHGPDGSNLNARLHVKQVWAHINAFFEEQCTKHGVKTLHLEETYKPRLRDRDLSPLRIPQHYEEE